MRVLVTGSSGFVGSHVVDALAAGGHDVIALDRARPSYGHGLADHIAGDVTDRALLARLLTGVDAVTHQAAMVGLGVDFADVERYVVDNDLGTATLLHAMHDADFTGRLVLASSMVVYGEGTYLCANHGTKRPPPRAPVDLDAGSFEPRCEACDAFLVPVPVTEDAVLDPRNVYAATKLHQEHLCQAFAREHGLGVTALRYHNVYGPRMPRDTPYAGVASIFTSALRRGDGPRVFEDGAQQRDFVHVADVARANVVALERDEAAPGAYNIATGTPRSVLDLAHALADSLGVTDIEPVVTGEWRAGDVRHVFASPQRAADVLGFRAKITFEQGMAELASGAFATTGSDAGESP